MNPEPTDRLEIANEIARQAEAEARALRVRVEDLKSQLAVSEESRHVAARHYEHMAATNYVEHERVREYAADRDEELDALRAVLSEIEAICREAERERMAILLVRRIRAALGAGSGTAEGDAS